MKRLIILSLICFSLFTSCEKSGGAGVVGITVVNAAGVPIQNCSVLLDVPVDGSNGYYGTTDIDGYIEFKSGLHVYYDVTVWKGLWEGCDFVEIKPGTTLNKEVIIYPPGSVFNGCI